MNVENCSIYHEDAATKTYKQRSKVFAGEFLDCMKRKTVTRRCRTVTNEM